MEFTIVKAVPFNSNGAFWATSVENNGESAITTMPQKRRNPIKISCVSIKKKRGEIRQQIQDKSRAVKAIFLTGNLNAKYPPNIHDKPPMPIMKNESKGTLKFAEAWRSA